MNLRKHPRSAEFAGWYAKQAAKMQPLAGKFYRVAGPRHTTAEEILSGVRARKAGGRWNPPGVMLGVYMSREPETALREANEHFRYYGLPLWKATPKVVVAIDVILDSLLDLTAADVGNALPVPMTGMLAEDWRTIMDRGEEGTAQAMGRLAHDAGVQALLVPSKTEPQGRNLIVFRENFSTTCSLTVLNAAELDKLGKPA